MLFLTDGAPRDRGWFGRGHLWDRALYRQVRRREARSALALLGIPPERVQFGHISDMDLAGRLEEGFRLLRNAVHRFSAQAIAVPAYEGGHPDHDAANFLVNCLRRSGLAPTVRHWWEYSLYTNRRGYIESHWLPPGAGRICSRLPVHATQVRRAAIRQYRSQSHTLGWLDRPAECFRPLPEHDYDRPPISFQPVYEIWGMPWTAVELCRAFRRFSRQFEGEIRWQRGTASLQE